VQYVILLHGENAEDCDLQIAIAEMASFFFSNQIKNECSV